MTNSKAPSWNDIRARAAAFASEWAKATDERAQAQMFWVEFFAIFSIDFKRVATFEAHARRITTGNHGRIDVFWPGVLIAEHKSAGKSLDDAEDQALDYIESIDPNQRPQAIITSDFAHIRLLDLKAGGEPVTINTTDLAIEIERFGFIAGYKKKTYDNEEEANIQAAKLMGSLYEELSKDGYEGHEASILLTRLLFLLFGDDTGMWERNLFAEYISERTNQDGSDLGPQLSLLFQELDRPTEKRSQSLDDHIKRFPYVNGNLFKERLDIPTFDRTMRDQLLKCFSFEWGKISPAVFGSLFQTIKSKEARRELGEHYTPEKFILRTIGPLFLDELTARVEAAKDNAQQLNKIREQLRKQNYLDPACGCGNFLIVAYRHLRRLELQILLHLQRLTPGDPQLSMDPTHGLAVTLDQFSGIEIEEWPARIAETAMFLADHQSNLELAEAFGETPDRLPITKTANIVIGNALRTKWTDVCPIGDNTLIFGNPPFMGKFTRSREEGLQLQEVFNHARGSGDIDYVCAWFAKASDFMAGTRVRAALVATNSISMGEQPSVLWAHLFRNGMAIDFAHRTFGWTSEAPGAAAVHVVIVGFSDSSAGTQNIKRLFVYEDIKRDPREIRVSDINPYLVPGPNILVSSRRTPLQENVLKMAFGSMPNDGQHLLLSVEEAETIIKSDPVAAKFIRKVIGARELIQGMSRFCLWLEDASPADIRASKVLLERIELVRLERAASNREATKKLAATPHLFGEIRQPHSSYLAIPSISSSTRRYVPIGFSPPEVIATNKILTIEGADLYCFGLLCSSAFNAWNAAISGRLKSDFQVSIEITYNNFPWPDNPANKNRIEAAAQAVIDARDGYPTASLADLYDPLAMPKDLVEVHRTLDGLVLAAYGLKKDATENEILAELFKRYQQLTKDEQLNFEQKPKRKNNKKESA